MFVGSKVGLDVRAVGITQDFIDGTTTSTGRGLDVVISQNGFFRMTDSSGSVFYSRNGQFKLDENRNIANMQGLQLTGYPTTGTPPTVQQGAGPAPITIPSTLMMAKSVTTASMQISLNSVDKVPTRTPFNPSNADSYNKEGGVTVFDSQGNAHDMNISYVRNKKSNTWEVFTQDTSTGDAEKSAGFMRFDSNGLFLGISAMTTEVPPTAPTVRPGDIKVTTGPINGAVPTNFSLSFLNPMQQDAGANNIVATNQGGYKPDDLVSYQINNGGIVVGNCSNEQQQVLGQIALTNSTDNEGLAFQGDNIWAAAQSSGMALLSTTGEDNFSKLTNGALEALDVDLSKELMNTIVARRNYQSNTQTVKTQDQILNTLINLC